MTIKNRVNLKPTQDPKEREKFISNGAETIDDKQLKPGFTSILIRVPNQILEEVNNHVEKSIWKKRNPWIVQAIQDKLNAEMK